MRPILIRRVFLVSLLVGMTVVPRLSAQAARVFLSGTGADAGDCSNAASPCRSLQYAITQAAPGAEVVILSSGGYGGATINKSLTINAPTGVVAFIGRTITVSIGASDTVVLRGLSLNGAVFADSFGINFTTGGALIVENSIITSFASAGIDDAADGSSLVVNNCEIRKQGSGVLINPGTTTATVTIENSRFESNTFGVNASGGLGSVTIRNSVLTQCQTGMYAEGPDLNVETCVITHNTYGIGVSDAGGTTAITGRVSFSTITDNTHAFAISGTAVLQSWGNNRLGGNGAPNTFSATIVQQ